MTSLVQSTGPLPLWHMLYTAAQRLSTAGPHPRVMRTIPPVQKPPWGMVMVVQRLGPQHLIQPCRRSSRSGTDRPCPARLSLAAQAARCLHTRALPARCLLVPRPRHSLPLPVHRCQTIPLLPQLPLPPPPISPTSAARRSCQRRCQASGRSASTRKASLILKMAARLARRSQALPRPPRTNTLPRALVAMRCPCTLGCDHNMVGLLKQTNEINKLGSFLCLQHAGWATHTHHKTVFWSKCLLNAFDILYNEL